MGTWPCTLLRCSPTSPVTPARRSSRTASTRPGSTGSVATGPADGATRTAMTRRADVADLVAFLAAVGPRIDEAMRVRWEGVDFGAGAVHIPGTKTETSDRTLSVARWAMDALRERYHLKGAAGWLRVPRPPRWSRGERDLRNVARALRKVFDDAGHPWAVPHTFRRTVATLLDARGVPLVYIADYLGHADPSMTARKYLGLTLPRHLPRRREPLTCSFRPLGARPPRRGRALDVLWGAAGGSRAGPLAKVGVMGDDRLSGTDRRYKPGAALNVPAGQRAVDGRPRQDSNLQPTD